jgi:MFS family permease
MTSTESVALAALYRKVSWRLLPFLFLLFVVAYLDRINISFAKLHMNSDLGFSDTVYGLGSGIFFLGYFCFEVPSNLVLHRVGAKRWLARIIIVWGVLSMATACINSVNSFYLLRFLLGVGEAGFFPGVIYYLTLWYPAARRSQTVSLFLLAIPFTGIVGSIFSGWLMGAFAHWQGLHDWQWLFVIEGLPAVVLGILTLWVLTDSPAQANWLTTEEKNLLHNQLQQQLSSSAPPSLKSLLCFKPLWQLAGLYFLLASGLYGISFWLPQIIHDFGRADLLHIGLLTAIPYAVAIVGMIAISRYADRHQARYYPLMICIIGTCIGFIFTVVYQEVLVLSLVAFSLATLSVLSSIALFWALPTALWSGRMAAGGIALINAIGGLGGYASPALLGWLKDVTQHMASGLLCLALAQAVALWLLYHLKTMAISA